MAAAAIFAQNPKVVSMIQDKLSSLVGRSSGYIESLPSSVRRRVAGLKGIQKDHAKLEVAFQAEVLELEKKYSTKFSPLYEKRAKIIIGATEPTEKEIKAGEEADEDEDNDKAIPPDTTKEEPQSENMTGIPEFWLSAMKNHPSIAELIEDRDEAALKHLIDIRMEYFDKPGFRLIFEFAGNEFFTNKLLTKTYIFQEEMSYGGEFMYDRAEGDQIDWKNGKNLTVRIESKKQRNKSKNSQTSDPSWAKVSSDTKQTRIVKKTVPVESFFNFFDPPKAQAEGDDDDEDDGANDEVEERLELDYQLGEEIREKLIPRAIDWFTGEALKFEGIDDESDEGDSEDEDDDEDDDLSEEKDDEDESDEEVINHEPFDSRIYS